MFLLLSAYLERCGVSARGLKRFPFIGTTTVTEQWTIKRTVPTTDEVRRAGWRPPLQLPACKAVCGQARREGGAHEGGQGGLSLSWPT